jgi:TusA-related sulfurtransferase
MRTTKEQTQNYFETLTQLQPETVVEILMNLYSRKITIEEWIEDTSNDIIDSEN